MYDIRRYSDQYLPATLDLIERSDSTSRTQNTWLNNPMTAVLAFEEQKLVGIIPFEKRELFLGVGHSLPALWVSGAHVEPDHRSQGIGSAMDEKVGELFPDAQAVFAFREDEKSAAYRWYRRIGYVDICRILSLKKSVISSSEEGLGSHVFESEQDFLNKGPALLKCFQRRDGCAWGYPCRGKDFWAQKAKAHYYKEFYQYSLVTLEEKGEIQAYAFLGQTSMRDGVARFDILEWVASEKNRLQEALHHAVNDLAKKKNLREIRIQLSVNDEELNWFRTQGYHVRWRTNIIGKLLKPQDILEKLCSHHMDFGLTWETPSGVIKCGKGSSRIHLFSHDEVLHKILLGRCNLKDLCAWGEVVVYEGELNKLSSLIDKMIFHPWIYFHIDYI
ncbi:MAG: GNAT family N-acetyltransferase [Candidatus Omnitrophica bacterium]|nr:GNAT family N-acetyltransferase [Candidatus Omnitrophota bacterium]